MKTALFAYHSSVSSTNNFREPQVVGTIITEAYLQNAPAGPLDCDLVELRMDGMPGCAGWVEAGRRIEAAGKPVFATFRLAAEGGHWTRSDEDRLPFLRDALQGLSGVDIELQSQILHAVAQMAREEGKFCIVSHHDFHRTPPRNELEEIIRRAQEIGSVVKIAAMIQTPEDLELLRSLLRGNWKKPLCLIGMGPLGRESRLNFPLEGSCLTYGYLDTPGAPGQFSAAELTAHLRKRAV